MRRGSELGSADTDSVVDGWIVFGSNVEVGASGSVFVVVGVSEVDVDSGAKASDSLVIHEYC